MTADEHARERDDGRQSAGTGSPMASPAPQAPATPARVAAMLGRSLLARLLLLAAAGYAVGAYAPAAWRSLVMQWSALDGPALIARAGGSPLLISTSTCPWCQQAREWLRAHRTAHVDCVVDQLAQGSEIIAAAGSDRVPQLIVGAERVYGYDADRYARAVRTPSLAPTADAVWRCQRVQFD